MNQREDVLRAWKSYSANAYPSPQVEKARAFFRYVDERRDLCWEEFVPEFRAKYYDALEPVSAVLIATNNPLIMHNFISVLDMDKVPEAKAAKSYIQQVDADRHQVNLLKLTAHPDMHAEILKKDSLPDVVASALKPKASPKLRGERKASGDS